MNTEELAAPAPEPGSTTATPGTGDTAPPAAAPPVEPHARRAIFAEPELMLRGLALSAIVGIGLGLGLWLMVALDARELEAFIGKNALPSTARTGQLGTMAATAAIVMTLNAAMAWRRRGGAAQQIWAVAARLSPLGLLPFLPLLWSWRLWANHPLTLLVLVAILGVLAEQSWRLARQQPPLLPSLPAWCDRWLAVLERATLPPSTSETVAGARPSLNRAALALVLAMATAFAVYFSVITVMAHLNLRTASFDLGIEMNLLWNLVHGGEHFKSAPLGGPDAIHFGYHATVFAYVLAPIYAVVERGETLLVVQATLLGAAVIPLYLWSRLHIGDWPAVILAAVYLLYPPLHGSILYDFHYPPLAPFFIWWAWYFLERRRDLWAALFIVLALSIREDVAAGMVVLGLHYALFGGRAFAGLVVASVATVYFSSMKFVIMPRFRQDEQSFLYMFKDLLPEGETGYGGVVKTLAGNPAYTLGTLLLPAKLEYALRLLTPILFLPLRRAGGLLLLLPGLMFTLLSTGYDPLIQTSFQYTTHWTIYLFPGIVLGLAHLARPRSAGDTGGGRRFQAALVALCLVALASSYQHGAILQQHTARGGFGAFTFGTSKSDLERRAALDELKKLLPPDARVSASELLVPQVANRANAYSLRHGVFDADYVLLEPRRLNHREKRHVPALVRGRKFGVLQSSPPFLLLKRGEDPDTVAPFLDEVSKPTRP